ncbi:hypothetical protein PO124_01525 [Bacillus licheniformis]|nr:hypothetical protein [Bacillus licheniformis]
MDPGCRVQRQDIRMERRTDRFVGIRGQTIKVMFNLQSDDSIEGDGLYIDDVALVKEVKSAGTKNDWALKNSRPK